MRVNLEIRDANMAFPPHLFILRGEDIYCSQVYPLFHFPAHPLIQTMDIHSHPSS